jgi:hypothetical protein
MVPVPIGNRVTDAGGSFSAQDVPIIPGGNRIVLCHAARFALGGAPLLDRSGFVERWRSPQKQQ